MFKVDFDEGKKLIQKSTCECGHELVLCWGGKWGSQSYMIRCGDDPEGNLQGHQAIKERVSPTEAARRGEVALPPERKLGVLSTYPVATVMAMIKTRFPRADMDDPSAATFLLDCIRLDVDPLLGEVVPVTFRDTRTNKKVVTPLLTEDGWLSLAARACSDKWGGPPVCEPITDPEFKKALLGDDGADAWLWQAVGKTKDGNPSTAYGWVKRTEWAKAQAGMPMADLPGNQARVRAIKRWVRETFPEARSKMRDITSEFMARAGEVTEALQFIEAEYRVLPAQEGLPGPAQGAPAQGAPEDCRGYLTEKQQKAIFAIARKKGWDDMRIHSSVRERFGKEIVELSIAEASTFIDALQKEGAML
jgi:hypothetical protein